MKVKSDDDYLAKWSILRKSLSQPLTRARLINVTGGHVPQNEINGLTSYLWASLRFSTGMKHAHF